MVEGRESVEERLQEVEAELRAHEVQCEERWKTTFTEMNKIEASVNRIEARIVAIGGGVIIFLAGLIASLFMR